MYRSRGCLNNSILNPLWAYCCQSANASATEQSTQKYLRKTHAVSLKELQTLTKKRFLQINRVYFSSSASFLHFYLHARVDSDCWFFSFLLCLYCSNGLGSIHIIINCKGVVVFKDLRPFLQHQRRQKMSLGPLYLGFFSQKYVLILFLSSLQWIWKSNVRYF